MYLRPDAPFHGKPNALHGKPSMIKFPVFFKISRHPPIPFTESLMSRERRGGGVRYQVTPAGSLGVSDQVLQDGNAIQ